MKIAIGPIEGHYGGAAQHILNIIKHSDHDYTEIKVPEVLRAWGRVFRRFVLPVQESLGVGLKHSDKRFDMYGLQRHFDLPGFITSRFTLNEFDAVHLHGHPYWYQIYQVFNPNRFFTVHNLYKKDDFLEEWHKAIGELTKEMIKVCKRSKRVITVAKWLQESMRNLYGVDSVYIPNGVNVGEFEHRDGDGFRQKFGVEEDFYLFVGRATKYKRPELFAALAESMPNRRFVMIGRGLTPKEFSRYLKKQPPENLSLIGEPERQDVVNAFDACRVFVLPSANETFGIVFLEGMVCGKPTVGANNLGPSEIIEDGKTGFLFKPDDLESLVKKTHLAWDAQDVGLAAEREVRAKYDWKRIVPQIEQVYIS